jgi:hypothetical protein
MKTTLAHFACLREIYLFKIEKNTDMRDDFLRTAFRLHLV